MATKYQESIAILQQRVELFRKGVESRNIQNMLDSNVSLVETLRHSNNIYISLPSKEKKIEEKTLNKSKDIVNQYFHIKSGIGSTCVCQILGNGV